MTTPITTAQTPLSEQVAAEIRAVMGRQDINKAQLARRLGVNEMWIGRRLSGKLTIDLNDLARIAYALDVRVVDLIPVAREDTDPQPTRKYMTAPDRAVPADDPNRVRRHGHRPSGRPQKPVPSPTFRRPARTKRAVLTRAA